MIAYLAGPMNGQTPRQANSWRSVAYNELQPCGFTLYNPFRGKDFLPPDETLSAFAEPGRGTVADILGSTKGIFGRDIADVRRCDIILAYFLDANCVSIGTVMELAIAHSLNKLIVACIDHWHDHPFVEECVTYSCPDLNTAIEIVKRLK